MRITNIKFFIEEAKKIHGDKYDYSLSEYKGATNKLKIVCPKHGIFEQTPSSHVHQKAGCPICGKEKATLSKTKTTEQFIKDAKLIHGDKYNYSLTEYKGNKKNIKIKCNKCNNIFLQRADSHIINKQGCPFCYGNFTKTTEQFIKDAKLIHGDKYDYSESVYVNSKTKLKIKCNKCNNIFLQKPNNHLLKNGCPICYGTHKKTTEQFIEEAKKIHGDRYDYSETVYVNSKTKLKIKCIMHGDFLQRPNDHLRKNGCPICKESYGEKEIAKILKEKNIKYISQKKYNNLMDIEQLSYDFYVKDKNLLIEYNGEQHYKFNKFFHKDLHCFHKQLHHDWLKRKYARDNKINLLIISYLDFNNIENILKKEIG